MKAVLCCGGDFDIADVPDLRPGTGQVLLNVSRAGICGSDVHLRTNLDHFAHAAAAVGGDAFAEGKNGVIFGHEFSGEVTDYGPDTHRRWKPGTLMVAMPMCRHGRHPHIIGSSPEAPGAFAEQMVVQESMAFAVPNGLSAEHAALTEPMSVAWHAVRRSQIEKRQTAYVIGCGPIGLAVIALLKATGIHCVVASDLSPRRRELAARCGADVVVDPTMVDPFTADPKPSRSTKVAGVISLPNTPWSVPGHPDDINLGFDAMEKLRRFALVPWWQLFRAMHAFDKGPSGPVVFECVGVPGILDRLITGAPAMSRIVVVGGCLEPDTFHPITALIKEVDLRFSVGYNPGEFRDTLHMLAEGKIDPTPFLTGTVGFAGVEAAFDALGQPERHAKVLIDPRSSIAAL
ncbi:zinc-binding dehydrogenase [Sphingobium sp. EM0848]|uniref:zinc-binding dehydrogenase n=1 Tax=Sphingobium sp. EM0848 TaxID=2743473 RepID=UPI00159CA6CE|nr:zinc-binding dehydrogenase [Sphingobium sp. EM0848]